MSGIMNFGSTIRAETHHFNESDEIERFSQSTRAQYQRIYQMKYLCFLFVKELLDFYSIFQLGICLEIFKIKLLAWLKNWSCRKPSLIFLKV